MIIKADKKRIISSWQFYAALAGGLILFLHPVLLQSQVWEHSSPLELFSVSMGISDFTPFAVIFAVLPYGTAFCMDCKTEYSNSIVSRIGVNQYVRGRLISTALSGASVMGMMMLLISLFCRFAAGIPETPESAGFLRGGPWEKLPFLMHGIIFYLLRIFLAMLFGSLWATVGLAFSAAVPNPYAALILPFVVYQVLWYLLEGSLLNPLYYLRADHFGIPSLGFAFGYQIFWNIAVSLLALYLMKRRLKR